MGSIGGFVTCANKLLEIVEQRLRLVGQTSQRRIGSHRADRLFALRRHGLENHPQIFVGVAERALAARIVS